MVFSPELDREIGIASFRFCVVSSERYNAFTASRRAPIAPFTFLFKETASNEYIYGLLCAGGRASAHISHSTLPHGEHIEAIRSI